MANQTKFGVFDAQVEAQIDARNLPHWFQPGVATFVTFRTSDSMPRDVVLRWKAELGIWLEQQGLKLANTADLPDPDAIPNGLRAAYRRQRDRLWNWELDQCHGACVLRQRELAEIVLNALLHFNGDRYDLASAIVMPNHVHLIAQFYGPSNCRKQCTSWMHYSATKINPLIGGDGAFWQSEPFDHLIRSEVQFHFLQRYVANNGVEAKLPHSDYLYWCYAAPPS